MPGTWLTQSRLTPKANRKLFSENPAYEAALPDGTEGPPEGLCTIVTCSEESAAD